MLVDLAKSGLCIELKNILFYLIDEFTSIFFLD